MIRGLILVAAMAASWNAIASDTLGTITILEGDALIYRGVGRLRAAEGVRLAAGDIVETAASAFAQVELADQSVAQLGPATHVMMNASAAKPKLERWLYIMAGWAKVSGTRRSPAAGPGFDIRSLLFEIPANRGVVVLRATPADINLFVEGGDVRLVERQASGASTVVALKNGDSYRRKASGRGAVNPGLMESFIGEMPKYFRDSLPLRLDRFRDQPVQAKEAPDFSYADVALWLRAEPPVRRPLVQRWRAKAKDPAFRAGLVDDMTAHPEWDPILFPEKYRPKDPLGARGALAVVARAASASASTPAH